MLFLLFLKMCWWCEVWRGCLVWPPFLLRKMGWYQRHPETCFKQCCRTVVAGKVGEHFPLICFPANPPPPGQGKLTRHTWDSQKVIVRRLYKSQQLMFLDIPFAFSNMTHPGFVIPNLQDPCLEGQLKAYGTLHPSSLKTNMRPWKSTNFETETYGNSSWKTSMLGQKMRKRRKTCLQKLPFVNFIRRRMAKDWYLGVCPMRVRRDSPIDTRQISLKPGSDGKNTREVWHYQS